MLFDDIPVANIAHRGASGHAPENTMPAFEMAVEMGADGIELDVQLSRDGEVIVLHDGSLDRTTSGSGTATDYDLHEIRQFDAGYYFTEGNGSFPFRGKGVQVQTLNEVLASFSDLPFIIELKVESGPQIVDATADVIREQDAQDRVIVGSFEAQYLKRIRALLPGVPTGFGKTELRKFALLGLCHLDPLCNPPADILLVPDRVQGLPLVQPAFIRLARRFDFRVHVWTIEETVWMREMLDLGVDGIMTGYPDRLRALLQEA